MKRKSRRKKDSDIPQTPETAKPEAPTKHQPFENNKDGSRQTSRSSSRSRRSLSSFFKRSRDRHSRARSESSDRSKSRGNSSTGAEASDASLFNPRTEPRDHLRRMTVREALAESRTRGRSPNRRAIYNLEKKIMSPEELKPEELNNKALSTSLPDIPDLVSPDKKLPTEISEKIPHSNFKPLDQSGKKRGYSGGQTVAVDSFPNTNTSRKKDNFQPLDKRKYIINKDNLNSFTQHSETTKPYIESVLTAEADVHSRHSSRDPSPYSAFASENIQHRRESFAKFLELREKRPPRSSSNYSIGRQSFDSINNSNDHQTDFHSQTNYFNASSEMPAIDGQDSSHLPKRVCVNPSLTSERKSLATSPSSMFQPIKHKSDIDVIGLNSNQEMKNIAGDEKGDSKNTESKRGEYVSPRRFSRKSNTSKKSNASTEPVQETISAEKCKQQPESAPTKRYQRKFSNSSEKHRRKISRESNISKQEAECQAQNTFKVIKHEEPTIESHRKLAESLSQMYNNEIQMPKAIPAVVKATDRGRTMLLTHGKDEQNSNGISTGIKNVVDRTQEVLQSVSPGNDLQFPNSDFGAIPLESITNDLPFKARTQSETDANVTNSRTRSRSKSAGTSKKGSSNSGGEVFNIENLHDILLQDDVFETNIDEISVQSGDKTDTQVNQERSDELVSANTSLPNIECRRSTQSDKQDKNKEKSKTQDEIEATQNENKVKGKSKVSKRDRKKKKKSKSDDNVAVVQDIGLEKNEVSPDNKRKSKKGNKGRKKFKSKNSRSMSDLRLEDSQTIQNIDKYKENTRTLENDKIVKIEESTDKPSKGKIQKRKSFFRRSRRRVSKTPSVQQAIVKVGRAASLSNILDTPELKRKPPLTKTDSLKRSHSVEDMSMLKHNKIEQVGANMPESIFHRRSAKDAIWNIETELPKNKEKKQQPKLSISAIIALRAKVGRFKKAKQEKEKRERESKNESTNKVNGTEDGAETVPVEKDQKIENDSLEACDREVASVVFENELNVSLNKQKDMTLESAVIEDELDNEIASIVHEKKIHFDSYIGDIHLSEEEMIKQRQRNTRLTTRRESKVRQRQKKVINCCKQVIAFLFSHIGLCSLVVAYCIAGGFIFKKIEGMNELEKKREMQAVREDYTNQIFSLAFQNKFTKRNANEFKKKVEQKLYDYGDKVNRETKAGWDGKDSSTEPEQWSFPSSLLYAITVMTTIGYGHVAPKTNLGRIVTIGYAVFGIPLTLLCLTNLGDLMAKGFRWLYGKVFCGVCCLLFRPSRKRRIPDPEKGLPANEERMLVQEEEKSEELTHVPTSVCLLLMTAYVLLGTFAFCEWEGWDMVTGTYFCFITLSTIGFGDVVPGMTSDKWDMNEKLVLCAFYLIIGLSLIAMCFNLVQEDVKAKCKWLGTKLGIIDKPVTAV